MIDTTRLGFIQWHILETAYESEDYAFKILKCGGMRERLCNMEKRGLIYVALGLTGGHGVELTPECIEWMKKRMDHHDINY
jgi:hypothetical protein